MTQTRVEKDSMGELEVPINALYGAQTQRAVNNFPVSGLTMPRSFIKALGLIKSCSAEVNQELKLLDADIAKAIVNAANEVAEGSADEHFPVDVFQTGSGTSTNMNSNEVIANLARHQSAISVHPNDHVNMGQSSNDVIPTAIHLSASLQVTEVLLPAIQKLINAIDKKSEEVKDIVVTGRTHLMDAMPLTLGQELSGWLVQIKNNKKRIESALNSILELPLGGTAVGTGINSHANFSKNFIKKLSKRTQLKHVVKENFFEGLSSQDSIVELSGQLKTLACSLMKISNDLRWMNSGPLAGIGEIALPAVQPGSSIMPGKVNPVIPESVCMVAAQVIGNDSTITVAGQSGNFQLNVMLPVIGYNILQSIEISANACTILADNAIAEFSVNVDHINEKLAKNPILVTALNPVIGYELGAKIAKTAYQEKRAVLDVATDMTDMTHEELASLLNPSVLTRGGINQS